MILSATVIPKPTPILTQHLSPPYKNEFLEIENLDFGLYI